MNCFVDFLAQSGLLTSIVAILGIWLTAYLSIKHFYSQQRTNRLQVLYFENSLLAQVHSLESDIGCANQSMMLAESIANLISNFIKPEQKDIEKEIVVHAAQDALSQIRFPETITDSKKEVILELFGNRYGDPLNQWIGRTEHDVRSFIALFKSQCLILIDHFKKQSSTEKVKQALTVVNENILNHYRVVEKNYMLLHLLSRLVLEISSIDFKNKNELLQLKNSKQIKSVLEKIIESFKILSGFYEGGSGIFYSYAKDENGKIFKVVLKNGDPPLVTREDLKNPLGRFGLLPNEFDLANAKIADTGNNFFRGLMGLANLYAFEEKYAGIPILKR